LERYRRELPIASSGARRLVKAMICAGGQDRMPTNKRERVYIYTEHDAGGSRDVRWNRFRPGRSVNWRDCRDGWSRRLPQSTWGIRMGPGEVGQT